jgi:hypothetical protein
MERGELSRAGPDIGVQQQRLHQQNNQFSLRMHGEKKIEGGAEEVRQRGRSSGAALSVSISIPSAGDEGTCSDRSPSPSLLFDQSSTRTEERGREESWKHGRSCAME